MMQEQHLSRVSRVGQRSVYLYCATGGNSKEMV